MSAHLKYRAHIDGLRAVAVMAVLLFHADLGLGGGYVGVDVFFVISGYLITGLILKDLNGGHFKITEFWERRIRRILPALVVVVLACFVAGWFLYFPLEFKELGKSVIAQALLVSNVYFWKESGYFAPAAEVKPLLHTWSLAVEEQFYLLFPFLLVTIYRFSRQSLVRTIILLWLVSFSLSVYWSYTHAPAGFFLLPTRAWELLIGAFLATVPAQRKCDHWLAEVLSWSGLLAILCAVYFFDRETKFPGFAAALPCFGTAAILWTNNHTSTSIGRLLGLRPVVFVGLISYSLYLWHWPVLVFAKYMALDPIPWPQRVLLLLASMLLAVLSWRFVEAPFRKRTVFKSRTMIFSFAGFATAVLLLAGGAIFKLNGVPSRIPAEALQYADAANEQRAFLIDLCSSEKWGLKDALAGNFPELGAGDKTLPIEILVWGDSHAAALMHAFDALCSQYSVRGIIATHASTPPLLDYGTVSEATLGGDCIAYNKAVADFIRSRHVRDVVLVANWNKYIDLDNGTERIRGGLLATIGALQEAGVRIWVVRTVPRYRWSIPDALGQAVWRGRDPETLGLPLAEYRKQSDRRDPIFQGLEKLFPNVTVLDPASLFVGPNNLCRTSDGGKALYFDEGHLSPAGAMLLRPLFDPIFKLEEKRLPKKDSESKIN
jgi:peptidoglycan/LPS O-acetylase OafA/YrhL